MCKHTKNIFSPDCSFKICEKPIKFSKSVRTDTVSAKSMTTWTHVFREYLQENEKVHETVFDFHMGHRSNLLIKKIVKILLTLSL